MKISLALLFCIATITAHAAVPSAEKLLPADTLAFLTVPNWPAAQSNFLQSSFGEFLKDPAMKALREKFIEKFSAEKLAPTEKELGIKFSDYTELVRGQLTLAIVRKGWTGDPDKKPGFAWIIDTGEKSAQAKTNLAELRKKWVDSGKRIRTDKVRDVEFTTFVLAPDDVKADGDSAPDPAESAKARTPDELTIGQSDSLVILTDSLKDAEKIVALQGGSSIPALADQAAYVANAVLARDAGAFLWIDVKTIMASLARKTPEERNEQPSLLGPPPTIDKVLAAVGLSGVQTLAGNLRQGIEGQSLNIAVNVPEAARKGLFRILAVDQKDASPPPFVPADAIKFSRWRIDLQKAWNTIEMMMTEISPASGGVLKLVLDTAGKDQDPNFDFRKALLGNLGDDLISYEKSPRPGADPEMPPSLTLIGSKNAEQLAASMKAITSIIPPSMSKYSEREFLGRKVYSFTWPSMGEGKSYAWNYAASGGYVAFSTDVAMLEEYLRSNEGRSKSLRDAAGLNDAAQRVGGMNTGFFAFENQNEAMRAKFELARKDPSALLSLGGLTKAVAAGKPRGETNSFATWFDPSLLPPYERVSKYFGHEVVAVNVSPLAITFRVFAPTPAAMRK